MARITKNGILGLWDSGLLKSLRTNTYNRVPILARGRDDDEFGILSGRGQSAGQNVSGLCYMRCPVRV